MFFEIALAFKMPTGLHPPEGRLQQHHRPARNNNTKSMKRSFHQPALLGASVCLLTLCPEARAAQLLVNGGFESGSLAGWTVEDQAGGSGSFFVSTPGASTPLSGFPTAGSAANGSFYAVTDQTGPGTHALLQSFTVEPGASSVTLSFDMFVNDSTGNSIVDPAGLDFNAFPNQHARVDILSAGAGAFDTGAGVLGNFYLGSDGSGAPHDFTSYSFDITGLVGAGGDFQLRFAEVDNQGFFNHGVDNASIVTSAVNGVPDGGSTLALFGLAAGGLAAARRGLRLI
ncbi:MAG: VPDSG-CTERM sorting domain-containing protein [Verrucomicrobiaceae bacterium]|nr:MAG: VPDSG-CTERM sorting domain-containing protein [Verrucomicrobiaceae bacterium]